jgi:hypothetical protein
LVVSGEVKKQKEGEGNGKLAIYDITKHVMLTTRSIELGPTVVVFSPDSRYVATGDVKGRTHTFEVGSWKETSEQEQGMLVGLAFRTNDKTESKTKEFQLISAELDSAEPRVLMIRNQGTIEDPAVRACRLVTRNLSKKQWQEDAGWWAAMYERACPNRDWPDDCWHLRHLTCF